MVPEPNSWLPPPLQQRTPGETDLRIFTAELVPGGRHRLDGPGPRLRVIRDGVGGGVVLRPVVCGLGSR
jgi:hypothetical protein